MRKIHIDGEALSPAGRESMEPKLGKGNTRTFMVGGWHAGMGIIYGQKLLYPGWFYSFKIGNCNDHKTNNKERWQQQGAVPHAAGQLLDKTKP